MGKVILMPNWSYLFFARTENIVDQKLKMHAYLFSVSIFNFKNIKQISKIGVFVFSIHKNKNVKIKKMVQADLYFVKLKKINFEIWPD